jgi:imidazolonepropionase-like amidohydrolase
VPGLEAIQCATQNSADVLALDKEIGTIREGLIADLLIVEGDPLEDIKSLKNVVEVYRDGEIVFSK